ncbi:MAG: DUF4255 domain-containing protein [Lachnospiraceae bacterium]
MKYTAVADVGNAIVEMLQEVLVPDLILNPEHIALCSPGEKGDTVLGIYLYDVSTDEGIQITDMLHINARKQKYPPTCLSLSYMITAYSAGDMKFKYSEEQRILGKVIQVLKDSAVLDSETLKPTLQSTGINIRMQMQSLSLEEKYRIWNAPNSPYKLSLFYKASPILIESLRSKVAQRVVETEFSVNEEESY